MLELQPKPDFVTIIPPKLLQKGYFVNFSKAWPATLGHISGKFFEIKATNQVPYTRGYIIPSGDYRDVNLSNGAGAFQESIYPTSPSSLFEIALGFKEGNYLVHFYIPAERHIHSLEYAGMYPQVTSPTLVYLGARKPSDSPYEDPRIKIYLVKDLEPLILRLFVLPGIDYEKCVLDFTINKCWLGEIPSPSAEQLAKAKTIPYTSELRFIEIQTS